MEALQEQQRQAEELKLAEEEKRRIQLEMRGKEIEEEKRMINELKQKQEEVGLIRVGQRKSRHRFSFGPVIWASPPG